MTRRISFRRLEIANLIDNFKLLQRRNGLQNKLLCQFLRLDCSILRTIA